MGVELGEAGTVALEVAPPGHRIGVAGVREACQLIGVVALGRVGAVDPPEREVGADQVGEALEPVQQRPLLRRRQERVGDRLGAVEGRRLPAGADQDVAPRVAQREAAHGRTSSASPFAERQPRGDDLAATGAAPWRSPKQPALAPPRATDRERRSEGGERRSAHQAAAKLRRALIGRHPNLAAVEMTSAGGGQRSAQRAAPRRQAQRQPGEREAIGTAAVGRRLGGERGDRDRNHDQAQRPVEHAQRRPGEPGRRQRPGGEAGRGAPAAEPPPTGAAAATGCRSPGGSPS